jgi:hypothetical protein
LWDTFGCGLGEKKRKPPPTPTHHNQKKKKKKKEKRKKMARVGVLVLFLALLGVAAGSSTQKKSSSGECILCGSVVGFAENLLSANATEQEILDAIDNDLCPRLVDYFPDNVVSSMPISFFFAFFLRSRFCGSLIPFRVRWVRGFVWTFYRESVGH